jgi:hypothetical protein
MHWARASSLCSGTARLFAAALPLASGLAADGDPPSPLERLPRTDLSVFHDRSGAVRPVKARAQWPRRRNERSDG